MLLTAGCSAIVLLGAGYDSIIEAAANEHIEANGDMLLTAQTENMVSWDVFEKMRHKILALGSVRTVSATASVTGLLGNGEYAAPVSGIAVEDWAYDTEDIPIELGKALADTLRVSAGSPVSGLIEDTGMSFTVKETVTTEAILKDRFYVRVPVRALQNAGIIPKAQSIHLWLKEDTASAYKEVARLIRENRELDGYALYSLREKNTPIEKIVSVYKTNFTVVSAVIGITVFLAFLNVLSLSIYERQQELGTLRAMGTPTGHLTLSLTVETLMVALASAAAGILISLIVSATIRSIGGISFPPPPGSAERLRVGSSLSWEKIALAASVLFGSACASSLICTSGLGKPSVTKQLENRN